MDEKLDFLPEQYAMEASEKGQYYNVAYELEKFFIQPNKAISGFAPKYMNDGKLNGFKLFFHFDAKSGLLADENYINSGLAYLKRLGQRDRYELLKKFINLLSIINSQTPWMFQEITSGLKELWSTPLNNVLKDQVITIHTLETLDDKIQGLMMIYRQIVWDESRDVWILPMNLRQFSMSIYIYDYRYFSQPYAYSEKSIDHINFLQTQQNSNVKDFNHTLFDLGHCEFMVDSGSEAFEHISNNASEFVTSSLHIHTKHMEISGLYKTLFQMKHVGCDMTANFVSSALTNTTGGIVPDDIKDLDKWKDNLKDLAIKKAENNVWYQTAKDKYEFLTNPKTWKRELGNIVETGINTLENKLNNAIADLYMGNVYGFSLQDFIRYGDSGSIFNDVKQSIRKNSQITSMTLDDDNIQKSGELGNALSDKNSDSAKLDDDNIQKHWDLGKI